MPLRAVTTLDEDFKAMTVSGTNLVALDFNSDLYSSEDDGANFTLREITDESYEGLGSVDNVVVAVGVDGLILRSIDFGLSWDAANSETLFSSLRAVAGRIDGGQPNRWIAVGDDGFDGQVLQSVDNGVNWSAVATFTDLLPEAVIWTGNRWLLAGRDQLFNEGVVYSSTDGVNWSASATPAGAQPLLDLAADGSGSVLAVGESGQILRSSDDGLTFSEIVTEFLGGGDLNAVVVDSSGTFFAGGDEKLILEINASTATVLAPATSDAPPVTDLILIDDAPVAIGAFFGSSVRTEPLTAKIAVAGSSDFVITAGPTLSNKNYFLETTTDLTDAQWTLLSGSQTIGNGADVTFEVNRDANRRFWRVVEF
jgi:photosystem II stability/assembly factor-like uncharacterized protein